MITPIAKAALSEWDGGAQVARGARMGPVAAPEGSNWVFIWIPTYLCSGLLRKKNHAHWELGGGKPAPAPQAQVPSLRSRRAAA